MEDPLNTNIDVNDTEAGIPLFPEQNYECQVTKSAIEPNKARTGHNWNLELTTVGPVTDINGKKYNNTKFFVNNIALQSKDDGENPEGFKRNIASALDAVYGTSKGNRPTFNRAAVDSAIGKRVIATVIIDEYKGDKNNKVKKIKKAA